MVCLLKNFISQFGKDALFDTDKLIEFFTYNKVAYNKVNKKELYQLVLILKCGNISDFIERNETKITSVEINNIIIGCVRDTGLSRETVKTHLYDILFSLGIDCEYEKFFIPSEASDDIEYTETSFISTGHISNELSRADKFINNGVQDKAFEIYIKLAKSGSAAAMYNLGMCYFDGIGTEKSEEKGLKWIEAAAANGDARAKIKLGDYYYFNDNIVKRNFSKAYELYSGIGVLTVNPKIKNNIVNILNQKKINFIVLTLGAILTLIMWLFLFINPQSVHHGSILVGWGIPLTIVPSLIYGFACYLYKKLKYTNLKILITAMLVIWLIYPLILAIN